MRLGDLFCRSHEFKQALENSRPRLFRVAYSWTHDAALADDLVQDTLTKAWQKREQLRDADAQDAWLFTILTNCFRDNYRRHRETEDIDEIDIACDYCLETEHIKSELVSRVRSAIKRLPEGQRQVVTLVDLEGFSYVEVAEILSIPSGTVMSRLCRARGALKSMLLSDLTPPVQEGARLRRIK